MRSSGGGDWRESEGMYVDNRRSLRHEEASEPWNEVPGSMGYEGMNSVQSRGRGYHPEDRRDDYYHGSARSEGGYNEDRPSRGVARQYNSRAGSSGLRTEDGANRDEYRGGRDEYRGGRDEYRGGRDEYRGGRDEYRGGRDVYRGGRDEYRGGRDEYRGGREEYRGGGEVSYSYDPSDQQRRGSSSVRTSQNNFPEDVRKSTSGRGVGSRGSSRPPVDDEDEIEEIVDDSSLHIRSATGPPRRNSGAALPPSRNSMGPPPGRNPAGAPPSGMKFVPRRVSGSGNDANWMGDISSSLASTCLDDERPVYRDERSNRGTGRSQTSNNWTENDRYNASRDERDGYGGGRTPSTRNNSSFYEDDGHYSSRGGDSNVDYPTSAMTSNQSGKYNPVVQSNVSNREVAFEMNKPRLETEGWSATRPLEVLDRHVSSKKPTEANIVEDSRTNHSTTRIPPQNMQYQEEKSTYDSSPVASEVHQTNQLITWPATYGSGRHSFVLVSHPHGLYSDMIQCTIVRDRSSLASRMCPAYELILEEPRISLMLAQSQVQSKNYHLFDLTRGQAGRKLSKKSGNYIGKVRPRGSNGYSLQTHHTNPEEVMGVYYDKATFSEERNPEEDNQKGLLAQLPRKMKVVMPRLTPDRTSQIVSNLDSQFNVENLVDLIQKVENVGSKSGQVDGWRLKKSSNHLDQFSFLESKAPRYENGHYRLDFHGRVTKPSVKNFQLVAVRQEGQSGEDCDPEDVICQFGKVDDDVFHLDFKAPINPFQAFALALSQFNL